MYWLCVCDPKKKHIFRRSCPLSLPFLGQETPDVAETEKPGTEKAATVVFYVFFSVSFFFRQGHFPTQVFTCQEETQTSYGHRCGHIWSQYGVLRFMGIELRMWYYDTLDCTNIYIYMLSNRRSWPGEIWCGSARSTKQTGGQVSIGCCWFQFIYIYI